MKTCHFCKSDNMDDAKYCKECGTVLAQPSQELTEREILLQVRDLLDKSVKQSQEWQREARQNIEKAWQRDRERNRIFLAAIGFLMALMVVVLVVAALS